MKKILILALITLGLCSCTADYSSSDTSVSTVSETIQSETQIISEEELDPDKLLASSDTSETTIESESTTIESEADTSSVTTKNETTADSTETTTVKVSEEIETSESTANSNEYTFILNTNTKCFHKDADCRAAKKIKEENYETRTCTAEELLAEGYKPCGICNK